MKPSTLTWRQRYEKAWTSSNYGRSRFRKAMSDKYWEASLKPIVPDKPMSLRRRRFGVRRGAYVFMLHRYGIRGYKEKNWDK